MKNTFIQWKGTDLCMDFICPNCGYQDHFDGYGFYTITCTTCKAVFRLSNSVELTWLSPKADLPIHG